MIAVDKYFEAWNELAWELAKYWRALSSSVFTIGGELEVMNGMDKTNATYVLVIWEKYGAKMSLQYLHDSIWRGLSLKSNLWR